MDQHIYYIRGIKYQVTRDITVRTLIVGYSCKTDYITLRLNGDMTLHKGFVNDGASFIAIDTKSIMRGAGFHDGLYKLLRLGLLPPEVRPLADQELKRMYLEDQNWRWFKRTGKLVGKARAWWIYRGVRRGAGFAAAPRNKRKEQKAP